jgi:general stress protein YciG
MRPPRRGFASMSPKDRQAAGRKGGTNAHANGNAYEWDSVAAKRAGKKGGQTSRRGPTEKIDWGG